MGGMAKQVLGIANGVVGAAVITKCKMASMQPSLMIYMAGSIVFVAAEVAGGKKKTKDVESQAQSLDQLKANMKEGGDYQMAAIEERIKDEKSTLEFIQKRRKWMMATKAIYAAATAMAILEIWWQMPFPVGINKDWSGACAPDPSHTPLVMAIAMAYGAAMSSGGTLKGFAISAALGVAVQAILTYVGMGAEIADKAIMILDTAPGRVAFFAAATALVMMIDSELAKEESESKKRLADLEKVRDAFKANSQATNQLAEGSSTNNAAGANGEGSDPTDPSKKPYEISKLAQGTEAKKQCFSRGSDGSMSYSESGCKNSIKLVRPKFEANMDLPTLKSVSNLATDMGQAVANGDMGKADLAAGELANMAGRMDAVKDGLMKKLNDQMKKDGKKPIDINGELQRQVTALNNAINKQNPGAGNLTVAGLGDTSGSSSKGEAEVSPVNTTANTDLSEMAKGAEAPAQEVTPVGADASGLGSITEDSLGIANAEEALGVLGMKKVEGEELNFTTAKGDISAESESSIFKQVSNRYFLNYNRFFQRKEVNPPLAAPAPSN